MTKLGYGTIDNPMSLSEALNFRHIQPGHTLYLRGGRHTGTFLTSLAGTAENPIIIEPYQNEHVIIDMVGSFGVGPFVHVIGHNHIEFMSTNWLTRVSTQTGSEPTDVPTGMAVSLRSAGSRVQECILHDLACGFSTDASSINAEMVDCVLYYCGWDSSDPSSRGHGHNFYCQNETGIQKIINCITFSPFALPLKIYTEGTKINNFWVEGNTVFNACSIENYGGDLVHKWPILLGAMSAGASGGHIAQSPVVINNMTYDIDPTSTTMLGYSGGMNNATLEDNYFYGLTIRNSNFLSNVRNTVIRPAEYTTADYPDNTYHANEVGLSNVFFVRQAIYNTYRGNVTVYNWQGLDSVDVDLSPITGLQAGDSVSVWQVQAGVGGDTATAVLDENKFINIDMRAISHTVATPYLYDAPATTFPVFGAFVVIKQ